MMATGPWFPTIYAEKCDGCKGVYKCVTFCPTGVLERKEGKAVVVNPLGCVYGCSACADLCPKDAILFPSRATAPKATRKTSLLHRVVCKGCGKRFWTDRETERCFDCEAIDRGRMQPP